MMQLRSLKQQNKLETEIIKQENEKHGKMLKAHLLLKHLLDMRSPGRSR